MIKINIKPLSINKAYQGRRFKTPEYKKYTDNVLLLLPNDFVMPNPPYRIDYLFGLSSSSADVDNNVKCCQDLLSQKYGFNDKLVQFISALKVKVEKDKEFFAFNIEHFIMPPEVWNNEVFKQ